MVKLSKKDPKEMVVLSLTPEQRVWYAEYMIAAILADNEVKLSEIDYLKLIFSMIEDHDQRIRLNRLLESMEAPPLHKPEGIDKDMLSVIFVELILITISDNKLSDEEVDFLQEIAQLFGFTESYFQTLMKWCRAGLEWRVGQYELISQKFDIDEIRIPFSKMNEPQKIWYAYTLVAFLMLDDEVNEIRSSAMKLAFSAVGDKEEKKNLKLYISRRQSPPLRKPPKMPQDFITLIFMEILIVLSADGELSYKAQQHFRQLATITSMPQILFGDLMEWSMKGASWKQEEEKITSKVALRPEVEIKIDKGVLRQHPENNSVLYRKYKCFICDSDEEVVGYQLKPDSHKTSRNIFGIPAYFVSNQGYDFCDYNLIKVIVCPSCYFCSVGNEFFKKRDDEKAPLILHEHHFRKKWLSSIKLREEEFKEVKAELLGIHREPETAVMTYEKTVEVLELLNAFERHDSLVGQIISKKLSIAEICMIAGDVERAEGYLMEAQNLSAELFSTTQDHLTTFKSARLLFIIGLYWEDLDTAGKYLDFFDNFEREKLNDVPQEFKADFVRVKGEVKRIFDKKEFYYKKELNGFHLKH